MVKQATLAMDGMSKPKEYLDEPVRWPSITAAKLAVMNDALYAKKTVPQQGSGISYSFLSESDLLVVLRPAMVKHGLTLRPVNITQLASDSWNSQAGKIQFRVRFAVTYEMTCLTESGKTESELIMSVGEGADTLDKAAGKAMTAAEKYALRQAFLIESGVDPDKYASQEVVSMAGSMDQEKEEAFLRFQGALKVAESPATLDKLRTSYSARGFSDKHVAALEELFAQGAARLAKSEAK